MQQANYNDELQAQKEEPQAQQIEAITFGSGHSAPNDANQYPSREGYTPLVHEKVGPPYRKPISDILTIRAR